MNRKRLSREDWWATNKYENTEYFQFRVDTNIFHGLVCYIKLNNGLPFTWNLEIAGRTAVIGDGMFWLQLVPDGKNHVITAKYLPNEKVSLWYVDIIEGIDYDEDGTAVFIDKYLDVIFTPQGDVVVADRDELDEAFEMGAISKEQYDSALVECDLVLRELCSDIDKTERWCDEILAYVKCRAEE